LAITSTPHTDVPTDIPSSPSEGNLLNLFMIAFHFNANHIINRHSQGMSDDQASGAEEEDSQNTTPHTSPNTHVIVSCSIFTFDQVCPFQ